MTDKKKKLAHLVAVERGRALGLVGAAAATAGEWLEWLWTTPGVLEAMRSPPTAEVTAVTAPTNTRAAYETTYSRMTTPKSDEHRERDPETLDWISFYVVTAAPSDTSPNGVVVRRWRDCCR
jgi:hypothetical protein